MQTEYFTSVFTNEKDMDDSEISVELRHYESKKEVVLSIWKNIKVDLPRAKWDLSQVIERNTRGIYLGINENLYLLFRHKHGSR